MRLIFCHILTGRRHSERTRKCARTLLTTLLTTIIGAIGVIGASAETISQKQSKQLAQKFFDIALGESAPPVKYIYNGKRLTTDRLFTPFYLYNGPRGGFVIISAENKVFPILGYSLKSTFDPDKISDTEEALLRNYALDIEEVRYNPEVPEKAISAWRDYDGYVHDLLTAPYDATDPTITPEEAHATLDMLWTTDAGLDSYADLYTPEQWQEMVDSELARRKSAAIGYIDNKGLHPAVVHGKKGDYYRIRLDDANDWLMRLQAGELAGDRQLLATIAPTYKAPEPSEEIPFAYYDGFMAERAAQQAREEEEMTLLEQKPVVKPIGAGHYDIIIPEEARIAFIYNIGGIQIGRRTYKGGPGGTGTNVAHINIEAEPTGFYFVLLLGESGKPYGFKIYR